MGTPAELSWCEAPRTKNFPNSAKSPFRVSGQRKSKVFIGAEGKRLPSLGPVRVHAALRAMRERALGIAAQYRQVVLVRMGRTLPAFGIGAGPTRGWLTSLDPAVN